jgi:hypothetical protein
VAEEEHRVLVDGLAATAVTLAERHERETTALGYLRDLAAQAGVCTATAFREAAAAITRMPQPPLESAEETERALPMRTVRGVPSAEDQLAAALLGREWLSRLADQLEGPA